MTTDLTQRLLDRTGWGDAHASGLCAEAAARIAELESETATLRAQLATAAEHRDEMARHANALSDHYRAQLADRDAEVERLRNDVPLLAEQLTSSVQECARQREMKQVAEAELARLREMPGEEIVEIAAIASLSARNGVSYEEAARAWQRWKEWARTDADVGHHLEIGSKVAASVIAAVAGPIRAQEKEACADLKDQVYMHLISSDPPCPCGNGRIPTEAYRTAVEAYAAAIRKGAAP